VRTGVLAGGGWRPIGAGAVSGGLSVARTGYVDGIYGNLRTPYSSSPHTSADTSGAAVRELHARLEGSGGWRLGNWGMGLSLAYETTDAHTEGSLTPRFRRTGAGGATAGIVRSFLDGQLTLGTYARILAHAQRVTISAARGEVARVYPIEGLSEPVAIDFATGAYIRRIERDEYGFGASASVRALGTHWVLWGGYSQMTEVQVAEVRRGAAEDRFEPSGILAGLAAQRDFADERGQLTLSALFRSLQGDATRAALAAEGVLFQADEQQVDASLDFRWRSDAWQAAILAGVQHESRMRWDILEGTGSDLSAWRPHGAIEAARAFGRLSVGLGAGVSSFAPSGTVPGREGHAPAYDRLIAPELALYASPAMGYSAELSARWSTDSGRRLWTSVGYGSVSPRGDGASLPFDPEGRRSTWIVSAGVTLNALQPAG
ncbi:MAG: hypothetical protein ACREKM_10880, partial [Longimicrobiales bacterium]